MAGHRKHAAIFVEDSLHLRARLCPEWVPAQPKLTSLPLEPANDALRDAVGFGMLWAIWT